MKQMELFQALDERASAGTLICRQTITLRNGRVIRRANGKPFCWIAK